MGELKIPGRSVLLFLMATLCMPDVLGAGSDAAYSVAAAACVPTGQTLSQGLVLNSAGEATFKDGGVGEIILICPVPSTLVKARYLNLKYKDDQVLNDGAGIVAALRKKRIDMRDQSGVSMNPVVETVASVDSDQVVPIHPSSQGYHDLTDFLLPSGKPLSFEHGRYFYYIQINMKRHRPEMPVIVAFASLR